MDIINISNEIDRKKLIQNAFLRKITKSMISFNALMHVILKERAKDMIKFFSGLQIAIFGFIFARYSQSS